MSTEELLPCPFCGGSLETWLEQRGTSHYVECADCGAQGPVRSSEKSAENGWNSRANKPAHSPDCAVAVNARHACSCGVVQRVDEMLKEEAQSNELTASERSRCGKCEPLKQMEDA